MKISDITSRKILNSAGKWTIETKVVLDDSSIGIASVPGGISKGKREVVALEAEESVKKIEEIKPQVVNKDFANINDFDSFLIGLDGTKEKSKLGGNTILSASIAFCKAMAKANKKEVHEYLAEIAGNKDKPKRPQMMVLILEGGTHGSGNASIQEFMAIVNSVERGMEIYTKVKDELHEKGESTNVGAEGAFSPASFNNDQVLTLLSQFLEGERIALDVAASSFEPGTDIPNYESFMLNYPIASIEDPYGEDEWDNWEAFGKHYNERILVVTDDLTTTNPETLQEAIKKSVGNAILVKPNQIGSVSETMNVVKMAHENGWKTIISHRGTDTNDDFVADFAVGVRSDYVKFGAPARGERVAKYNRLLEIFS